MKKINICFLLITLLCLTSCGQFERAYQPGLSLAPLESFSKELLNDPTLVSLDEDEILFTLGFDDDCYEEGFVLLSTSGASIDEVGVFAAKAEKADELEKKLTEYIALCQDNKLDWLNSYNPTETEKLKNAKVSRYGNYLIYSFLNEKKTSAFDEKIKLYFVEN